MDTVIVHGGARGADHMAHTAATALGMRTEIHHADWATYGKRAGYVRNHHMVQLGADACVAFIRNHSPGATMCATLAQRVGMPVRYFRDNDPC